MSDRQPTPSLTIQSHRGPYGVTFTDDPFTALASAMDGGAHLIVDERIVELYGDRLGETVLRGALRIEAIERNKSLDRMSGFAEHLLAGGLRRGDRLVALGGGIIQDIACFLASILLRGVAWEFYPTTLLAQADSCIGSKSSINVGSAKNAVGTFLPPGQVVISTTFLDTLDPAEVASGIGEMIKVHVIDGPASFDLLAEAYPRLRDDPPTLARFIGRSLEIKQKLIEIDEFDQGPRLVLNYGHSFGHAIESATDFGIPHGIAVTIGVDMANHVAVELGRMDRAHFERMHPVMRANAGEFVDVEIPFDPFLSALARDKKNTADHLVLILPDADAVPERVPVENDERFRDVCRDYLGRVRHS